MDLLERASFLRTLAEYAGEARQGNGRLVLVSGESGIGKTVLLEAFQQRMKGARWLWGACDGLLTPRPLGPLFDIGAQAGGELADLCRRGAQRDQLFAAFLAEIDSAAPVTVAVMEDVHWADEATADLLSLLGRRLGRMKALLLATYRDDELGDDHPLRLVLGNLATQRATRRIGLPPLSEEAVRALAGQREVDAAELYRVTGGNPFFVSEMLEAGWPSVPPTVRDAVGARLARSSPGTRRVVESAAVIGMRVDRSLLSSVLAGSASSVGECLTTGILMADGTGLRFRHELVRMAVEAGIAPHRKTGLHARLLAELEAGGDADPVLLAHHAEGAGDEKAVLRHPPGPELAWAYANLSTSYMLVGRSDEAVDLGEKECELGEGLHQAGALSHALTAIGSAILKSRSGGMRSVERALRIALDADPQEEAGLAYSALHEIVTRLNRFEDEKRYYAEGLAYCEGRELGVFSTCLASWRAYTFMLVGRWDEAADICAQMLGRQRISPVNRLNPLRVLGTIRGRRGESGAWELLDEALALADGVAEPRWIAPVRAARAELRWLSGQRGLAAQEARSAMTVPSGALIRGRWEPRPDGCPGSRRRMSHSAACRNHSPGRYRGTVWARQQHGTGSVGPTTRL